MMSRQPNRLWRPEPSQASTPTEAVDPGKSNGAGQALRPESQTGPILREARWDGRLARARAHVAVVVVYRRGDHQVVWPHERTRVLLHRRPTTMYEVDLGLHRTVITADLPSKDYAGSFDATISVQWRVFNPSAVVRHQVLDIEEALSATLLRRARGIARDFSIEQITAAEDKINDQLGGVAIDVTAPVGIQQAMREATDLGCLGAEYGLWTRVITHLALDEAGSEHNTKMTKLNWAIEEEKAAQKLRVLQDKNQQEIMADRIAVYREIVAAGDVERFALRLASHPDEISAITAIIREDQLTSRRDTIEFISHMVDSGVVERWEVSDQVKEALEWLRDATARVVTDKDHRNTQIDQIMQQRRRGRGKPIEESTASDPSPKVIIVAPEAVLLEEGTESEPSPEVIVGEAGLASPGARPESTGSVIHPPPDK
jgi:hypothetical protein